MVPVTLDEVVAVAILAHGDDEWTALVVAAARLGRALAEFDNARAAYVAANPPPPGGWPTRRPALRSPQSRTTSKGL